jgi:SNF2 family DNA or RNA helicase
MALTGTPMENHYGEFYSLVDLLVPGSLGHLEDFKRRFVNTEMVTREEMDELRLRIRPLLLRRTKKKFWTSFLRSKKPKSALHLRLNKKKSIGTLHFLTTIVFKRRWRFKGKQAFSCRC